MDLMIVLNLLCVTKAPAVFDESKLYLVSIGLYHMSKIV